MYKCICVLEDIDFASFYDFDFAIFPIVWNFILFYFLILFVPFCFRVF